MQNNPNISEDQQKIIDEIKEKEERARNMLGTSADFVDEGKVDSMYIDKVIEIVNSDKVDANTKAIVTALAAVNDQLVLINRAQSVLLQQISALVQLQAQSAGKLQMPRSSIVGI